MKEVHNFLVQAGNAVSPAALAEEFLRDLPPDVVARRVDDNLLVELKDVPPEVMADLRAGRSGKAAGYASQLATYAHAAGISPVDALMELHDEPIPRRILMVGQQLRGSSKAMTGLRVLIEARNALARSVGEPELPIAFGGTPWHPDEGSWSEFLLAKDESYCTLPEIRDDTENGLKVRQWQPAEYRGPAVPVGVDAKRVARDRKKAKLAKASRKRNR
jgi:hypothetical protein